MNDKPKTRQIDTGKTLDTLFPARFLKAEQLIAWNVTAITATIDHIQEEEVTPKPGQPAEWKPVIYLRSPRTGKVIETGYLLSAKVDLDSIKSSTSARTIADLIGKTITIKLATWKNDTVLRIDPTPTSTPTPAKPASTPTPEGAS